MIASWEGPTYAHCKVCDTDSKKHMEDTKGATIRSKNSLEDDISAAESYFTTFISEHNLPFLAADHFTKLCKMMSSECKVAEGFSCGRTKTTVIVKYTHVLDPVRYTAPNYMQAKVGGSI